MKQIRDGIETLTALRIYRHDPDGGPSVLREEWRCMGDKAVLTFCKAEKPLYWRVINAYWKEGGSVEEMSLSPQDGFAFLRALKVRFRNSTFVSAVFDKGVRWN